MLNAVRAGIVATSAEVVVITMADLSDDVAIVPRMVELIGAEGYDIVCASRYMPGGRQICGPRLKGWMSRAAGLSLHWLAGWPTHDAKMLGMESPVLCPSMHVDGQRRSLQRIAPREWGSPL